jgi:hypothetical protein
MSKITSLEYRNKMSLIKGGKGDITTDDPIHRHLRYDGSIRNGRWKCLICGKVGRDINAHHIESFKGILEKNNIKTFEEAENCIELWLPENGITLCISCHKLKHSKEGPWAELQENFHI